MEPESAEAYPETGPVRPLSVGNWVAFTTPGLLGCALLFLAKGEVALSDEMWAGTVACTAGGLAFGVAGALTPYSKRISPWSVVGGLLQALGFAALAAVAMWVRRSDPTSEAAFWILGWTGMGLMVGFLSIAVPASARSRHQ